MCGIFGILSLRSVLDRRKFRIPDDTTILRHRGPDDHGYYADNKIYLAHRRLSIIDLDSGKQPIFNEDGSICTIFNGEIFNFQGIQTDLERRGHRFRTRSDTEVIIHAYEEWGLKCVDHFRGMFAFAIWDSKSEKLLLVRDRLGIKPLFYAIRGETLYFASEMKAILQYKDFPRVLADDGLVSYLTLSYIPAPLTIYSDIQKLLPGHAIEVENGEVTLIKYWDVVFSPDHSRKIKSIMGSFMDILKESVSLRMISDVPLGAFLSGGVDSAAIVALMAGSGNNPVQTFSIGFGGDIGGYLDERKYAREVSGMYKTMHREYEVHPDVRSIIDEIVRSFDEPFADSSTIPTYYICKAAVSQLKVALSGLGGDELFGGYERYLGFQMSGYYNYLPTFLRNPFKSLIESIPESANGHYTINHMKRFVRNASLAPSERYLNFTSILSNEKRESLFSDPRRYRESFERCREMMLAPLRMCNAADPLDKIFYWDIKTYLPEDILACTDRMSMAHSLEVRVPFLDHKLVEYAATIPSTMKIRYFEKKYILRQAVKEILPKSVLSHRKQGFIGPMSRWLRTDLKDYVQDVLSNKNLDHHGIFNKVMVRRLLDEHFLRTEMNDKIIWALVMFQKWYELYMHQ